MARGSHAAGAALAAAALLLGGCGEEGGGGTGTQVGTQGTGGTGDADGVDTRLEIEADKSGRLRFDKKSLQAKTGIIEIEMTNPATVPHNIAIQGKGVDQKGPVVQGGKTSEVRGPLQKGTYTFYCSVPGHRQGGMEGTLKVS